MPPPWWDPRLGPGARTGVPLVGPGDPGFSDHPSSEPFLDAFTLGHLGGYGQVDAPSPWGFNRDVFEAEHPNYQGGYYNPQSGFYDSPTEQSFQAAGPGGPVTIGTGGPSWQDSLPGSQPNNAGPTPSQPDSGAGGGPFEYALGGSGQGDNQTTSQPDNNQPTDQRTDAFDMGSFVQALASLGDYYGTTFGDQSGGGDRQDQGY